jgi:uncharacterized protein YwqG
MKLFETIKGLFGTKAEPAADDNPGELETLRKNCWVPIVEEGDGEITGSKFSGIPYLPSETPWPVCRNCEKPMQLFLQLDSEALPVDCGKPWGDGLLQFFYCTSTDPLCEVDCQAFYPFSRSTLLRVFSPIDDGSAYLESPVNDAFPAKQIVGWSKMDDLPNWEEFEEHGLEFPEHKYDKLSEIYPRAGDKLLGWPLWIQGIEYPNCPKCDTRMQLVFQIDSKNNLPYMFGDVGCGHICQCPTHLTELAFGWACS